MGAYLVMGDVLVCLGCYNKIPLSGKLINKICHSPFWRLEG